MHNNYIKVEGNESLVRDVDTHAIINNNGVEYENYVKKRNLFLQQQEQIQKNSEDINNIKQDLAEIKELILMSLQNKG